MLELDPEKEDLVTPITNLMAEGKYEEARVEVNKIPTLWRIAVIWTIAAQTGIVL